MSAVVMVKWTGVCFWTNIKVCVTNWGWRVQLCHNKDNVILLLGKCCDLKQWAEIQVEAPQGQRLCLTDSGAKHRWSLETDWQWELSWWAREGDSGGKEPSTVSQTLQLKGAIYINLHYRKRAIYLLITNITFCCHFFHWGYHANYLVLAWPARLVNFQHWVLVEYFLSCCSVNATSKKPHSVM